MMTPQRRNAIAGLSLSAAALVALVSHEGYTDKAVIPVKGDVPTMGFGSTTNADGSKVKMGDTTSPVKALQRTLLYVQKADADIKRCVKAPLSQAEYDLASDFVYQYGAATFCKSSMVKAMNEERYVDACEAYKEYRLVRAAPGEKPGPGFILGRDGVLRYDCSTPGNKRCWGVWERQKTRYDKCMAAQ